MYLGWVRGRVLGATLVGMAFVAPSLLMVLALAALYVRFGGLAWMQALFYGIGAAVIAIIARSATKLVSMTLGRDRLLWGLFAVSLVVTAWTASEVVWLFVASGFVPVVARLRTRPASPSQALLVTPWPAWLVAGLSGVAPVAVLWKVFWYFAAAGLFVFGSGLAIVPFLHGGVVDQYHWLTERQFLDAVAVSMITPGPVVITVAFIGYLVAGPVRRPQRPLDPRGRESRHQGVRERRDGGGYRRDCRSRPRPRPSRPDRPADRPGLRGDARPPPPVQAHPGAVAHRRVRIGGTAGEGRARC